MNWLFHYWHSLSVSTDVNCCVHEFSPNCSFAHLSQSAPVQRSRSLSPASSADLDSGRRGRAEHRVQDLEELLQLKVTSC